MLSHIGTGTAVAAAAHRMCPLACPVQMRPDRSSKCMQVTLLSPRASFSSPAMSFDRSHVSRLPLLNTLLLR
jgi:hypothetical protein